LYGRRLEPGDIVRRGYDRIAERYEAWSGSWESSRGWFLSQVIGRLPKDAVILELGCGPGREAVELASRGIYTGVDRSSAMLSLARKRLPGGRFELADLTRLSVDPASLDAAVSFYVFNHLPVAEQDAVTRNAYEWLKPGGIFCASLTGGGRFEEVEEDWLGVPMYFAGQTRDDDLQMVRGAGFEVELSEVREEIEEGHGPASFHWVIGRKRA
jgi:SAM-dependent methyltransferase